MATLTTVGAMKHPDGMEIDLRYLSEEKTRHGRRVVYARLKGKRIRLKHPVSSPEFLDEYRAAVKALFAGVEENAAKAGKQDVRVPFAPKTLGWLIERYFTESTKYLTMDPLGRKRRRKILEDVKKEHGHKPMVIPGENIAKGVAKRSGVPGNANEWLKSLKALYTWAVSIKIIEVSPAAGLGKIKTESEGFYTWTVDDIRTYVKRHPIGTMPYLACMQLLFTGLRRSDAVKFGRQHARSGKVNFKTSKTGADLITEMPWPLVDAIEAMPDTDQLPYLLTAYGKPFASGAAFGNWFKDRCREAGLPDCSPHGLRKGGATICSENGGSEVELEAMYGWANNRQSGVYTKKARALILATKGFERIAQTLVVEKILTDPGERRRHSRVAP
ncbi:tyrosine-type recombinase/integrase [Labrys sp. La1]|uniref:tyrosine-type recombinase/integrase n=1 Tax=Labrys sp. La1 TaxID=3404917 RepID=UPI003EB880AC